MVFSTLKGYIPAQPIFNCLKTYNHKAGLVGYSFYKINIKFVNFESIRTYQYSAEYLYSRILAKVTRLKQNATSSISC